MKSSSRSIGIKLWGYFIFFLIFISASLWILEIILLQNFYQVMQMEHIKKVADEIVENYKNKDIDERLEKLASENSLLIIVANKNLKVLHSADEYSSLYNEKSSILYDVANPYRFLPMHYEEFLVQLSASENGSVCYQFENEDDMHSSVLVYGQYIPRKNNNDLVLYISTPLGALAPTVNILQTQLIIVSASALIIGFIMSYAVSKRFARPVKAMSEQANQMAGGDFDITFDKGFCSELDELAMTLDHTAKQLSTNDKLRRDLLANVSHDLRTPLTMIKGYAEMICDFSDGGSETQKQDLQVIIRETDRLTTLVNDILDYSKLQSGTLSFDFRQINISALTETVTDSFSGMCMQKNIKIEKNIEPDKLVTGDYRRLEQVLYNLISNAFAHTGEDRTVYVSVIGAQNSSVRIEIRDNGAGIDEEDLPHIWDRYFTNKTRSTSGTGLGLAIVKEILTAHDADFGVSSKKGDGSTFWFVMK